MINWAGPEEYGLRLGKKPAVASPSKFALWSYFDQDLPDPPDFFRHLHPPIWQDYDNKLCGNCVFAAAANLTRLWYHEAELPSPGFTARTVTDDYGAVTGYPTTDEGTDVDDGMKYWRQVGMHDMNGNRHQIDAYAWITLDNMKYLRAAVWTLGSVGVGFLMPDYGMEDFMSGYDWTYRRRRGNIVGGHFAPCVGIASNGDLICVSWGREIHMSEKFYREYADEVIGIIDLDRVHKSTNKTPEGFDEARLRKDLKTIAKNGRVYVANLDRNKRFA